MVKKIYGGREGFVLEPSNSTRICTSSFYVIFFKFDLTYDQCASRKCCLLIVKTVALPSTEIQQDFASNVGHQEACVHAKFKQGGNWKCHCWN